jgi:SPP1 family predicted phage head-tail adaptor
MGSTLVTRNKELPLGLYQKRITIQKKSTPTKTSQGDKVAYTDVLTTWAKINSISVQRLLEYGQMHEDAKYEVEMRYNRSLDITEGEYRIVWKVNSIAAPQYFIISSSINVDEVNRVQRFLISQNK